MARRTVLWVALCLVETILLFGSLGWAAEGIVSKVVDPSGNYCHLRYPAIREETLFTDRPVLKHPSDGDIIDFYGPCDHDPLGREEIRRQKADVAREYTRPRD